MTFLRGVCRDVWEGFDNAISHAPLVPLWAYRAIWVSIWALWIAGAVGWLYERLG